MKIKKGDQVLVISGKDKGRKGKVIKTLPREGKLFIEGINIRKKHSRPKQAGQKGQVIEIPAPLDVSNVKLICLKCGKAARIGYEEITKIKKKGEKVGKGEKVRVCKKCGDKF